LYDICPKIFFSVYFFWEGVLSALPVSDAYAQSGLRLRTRPHHHLSTHGRTIALLLYSVSQKIPPEDLWQFFENGWEFFNQILHAYYAFLSTLDCEFLFNYLQL